MNRKASACFIWAAGVFVAYMIISYNMLSITHGIFDALSTHGHQAIYWAQLFMQFAVSMAPALTGALVAAGIVIQALAPGNASPAKPADAGVDATA